MFEFKKIADFPRGTIYNILQDAYSYDARNEEIWENNWKETDDFYYDNPEIADTVWLTQKLLSVFPIKVQVVENLKYIIWI